MPRQYRTLSDLRSEMRAKLGLATAGAAAGPNQVLVDAHLRDAQTVLYWTHEWAHLRAYDTKNLGQNEYLLDYPTAANPDRIKAVSVFRGSVWSKPLDKGITPQMYTYQGNPSWPQRWEPYAQMEFWPMADQIYPLRIFYIKALAAFQENNDRASLDDTLIAIVATATLKAHYRQPDAAAYKASSDALLLKLKGKSWGKDVFRDSDWTDSEPLVRPQVVN